MTFFYCTMTKKSIRGHCPCCRMLFDLKGSAAVRAKRPKSECSLNVIVNVIGVFRGFPILSLIALSPYRIRVYDVSVVRDFPSGTASSPVSRTRKSLVIQGIFLFWHPVLPPRLPPRGFSGLYTAPSRAVKKLCIRSALSRFMVSVTWP